MLLKDQMKIIKEHQKSAPVKLTPMAHALGLKVFRVTDWPNNISGMLRKNANTDSGYAIYVNGNHPNVRKRFTVAHEIGHFILHENLLKEGIVEDALLRAEGFSSAVETEANGFAADLLMPWHLIRDQQDRGVESIEELADIFEVSNDAMAIRLLGVSYGRALEMTAAE